MWIPPAHSPFTAGDALRALGSGREELATLRRLLAGWLEADQVVLTDSGTHALQLALRLAGGAAHARRTGGAAADAGPVALPAYSCFDLVTAARAVEAKVVFYDVDPGHLGPVPGSLEHAVEAGARVVVVGNLFGYPLEWRRLEELRERSGCVLIEDAAQGLWTSWAGRPGGSFGDLTVLSFARGKGWTGSGGGALLARGRFAGDAAGIDLPPGPATLPLTGKAMAQWLLARPSLYGIPARIPALGLGETRYRSPTAPRAMAPYQAGLLLASRAAAETEVGARRRRGRALLADLEADPSREPCLPLAEGEASYLRLAARMPGRPGTLPRELRRRGQEAGYPRLLSELAPEVGVAVVAVEGDEALSGARVLVEELVTVATHSRA